jgi:hypothetical protein
VLLLQVGDPRIEIRSCPPCVGLFHEGDAVVRMLLPQSMLFAALGQAFQRILPQRL